MKRSRYKKEEVEVAVLNSISIAQALFKLGRKATGGNYRTLHRFIESHGISTAHFKGQGWNGGKKYAIVELEEYLNGNKTITSHKLRLRLLRDGIFEYECSSCKLKEWKNSPIPLQLDHIDGNNKNNSLSNLRLLCPNCHALTPTYCRSKSSLKVSGAQYRTSVLPLAFGP